MTTMLTFLLLAAPPGETAATAAPSVFGQPIVETFTATVTSVQSTDTVVLLVDRQPVTLRLAGVHALEADQRFSASATQTAARVLEGQTVTVQAVSRRQYGFCVGDLMLRGRSVAKSVVSAGLAWHYEPQCPSEELAALQKQAAMRRRGLWKFDNQVAPWVARNQNTVAQAEAVRAHVEEKAKRQSGVLTRVASADLSGVLGGDDRRPAHRRNRDLSVFDSRSDAMLYR